MSAHGRSEALIPERASADGSPVSAPAAPRALVLLGAGGHAKVVLALARAAGWTVAGVCDPALAAEREARWRDVPVLGGDEALADLDPRTTALANGIGQTRAGADGARGRVYAALAARGFRFPALVHPAAAVDPTAALDDGAQVMAGAVVQADCRIGRNSVVNTRASVDHDGEIGADVHVAPGATLCGAVRVGDGAFIGAGATVVPGVRIGARAFVAAGSLLARDLDADARWPAPVASASASQG